MDNGSVQNIPEIPEDIKRLYKTTWETSQKTTIKLSAERAPFIDHSQSLNLFMAVPTVAKLSSAHFYAWKSGLKTGMYYLRSKPASTAEKFTIQQPTQEINTEINTQINTQENIACSIENKENCEACSG
jgi:ribonucleotide reductase alpha subunit